MSRWRLLGELPRVVTREELRAQSLGGWNPWQQFWNRCDDAGIVIPDIDNPARARHVRTYWVEQDGRVVRFAADCLDSAGWRFYVPAGPIDDEAFEAKAPSYEGFWRSSPEANEGLPWPVPDQEWIHRNAFLDSLDRAEADAQKIASRGYSLCRLCGNRNGFKSFRLDHWEWPEGFRHYVESHQVRPSREFELFITQWARRKPRACV
jgi:hypothetical protein